MSLDSRDLEVKTTKEANDELKRELVTLRIKTKEMTLKNRAMTAKAKRTVFSKAKEAVAKAIEKNYCDRPT